MIGTGPLALKEYCLGANTINTKVWIRKTKKRGDSEMQGVRYTKNDGHYKVNNYQNPVGQDGNALGCFKHYSTRHLASSVHINKNKYKLQLQ